METPFFLRALVPCFLCFVFRFSFAFIFFFPASQYVCLRVPSSVQQLSESTYFIVRVQSACVISILPHLGIILFLFFVVFFLHSSYFSGGVFSLCSRTRYASTWFAYLDSLAFGFLCLTVWPQDFNLVWTIRKEAGVTADIVEAERAV